MLQCRALHQDHALGCLHSVPQQLEAHVRRWCSGSSAWQLASSRAQSGGWACSNARASSPAAHNNLQRVAQSLVSHIHQGCDSSMLAWLFRVSASVSMLP